MKRNPFVLGFLGFSYVQGGRINESQKILRELQKRARTSFIPPKTSLARIYLGLGEIDQSLNCLERAFEEQDRAIIFLKTEPMYDPLRSHPRYKALLRKMSLEP